jgi:hypothetical protein
VEDRQLGDRINALAQEEHALFERESAGRATDADQARLRELQGLLDQCWDLLRQRRARREFGLDPEEAQLRSQSVVKNYIG